MVLSTEWAQVEVVELSNDGNGLGFHLVGGRSTGVVVKHVVPGGAADRDGRLQPGDHLLQVGAVNVRGLSAEQVAGVVRAGGGGGGARLLVARRGVPGAACPPGTALVPTRLLHDADALHAHLLAAAAPPPAAPPAPPASPPDVELLAVRLHKNVYGLGITVAGYVCEREELCGIFVRSIIEGSSAERSAVRVNDRIVAVDGASLLPLSNAQAVAVLRATGVEVELLLERHLRGPKFEHLRLAAFPADRAPSPEAAAPDLALFQPPGEPEVSTLTSEPPIREPPVPSDAAPNEVRDHPAEPAAVIEPDLDSATTIDSAILETEGGGGGATSPPELDPDASNEEVSRWLDALLGESAAALGARWQAALGGAARVLVADVRRAADGLGLSVEGTAQVVRGRERHARHYVRGLRAGGAAGAGGARRGDELLQANAAVLRGAPHAAAVAALRALPAAARLVLARGEPRVPPPAPDPHASPPAAARDADLLSTSSSSPQPSSPEPPSTAALPPLCSPEPTLTMSSSPPPSPLPTLTTSVPRPHSPESTLSPPPHSPEFPLSTLTPPPRSPVFSLSTPTPPQHSPEPPVMTMTPPPPSPEPPLPTSPPPPPSPAPPSMTTSPLRCSSELQPPPRVLTPPPSPPQSPPGPPLALDKPQVSLQFFSKTGEESPSPGEPPPGRSSPPLQPVAGLALWRSEEELVELQKTAAGLGFSILDYQDPQRAGGTAIVVRGVVAGGAAAAAGRPRRGERVLSVNGASVRGASLAAAVAALKAAPPGAVRLGLARPRHDLPPSPP